ncbi:hypothetical protein [Streptomyces sp. NBC_01465]|uniref:hypothetical protein n=1 Tax=Streptomyces sp. NBC_01465 TaxID=2903878 RepID=UPI002E2FD152|nr:hypothetical protein [Streptomyces sp. NBC_01465]
MRAAAFCAAALLAMLLLVDGGRGSLSVLRGGIWGALAVALFVVLYPPRVTAGDDWLAVRGLLRERRVSTRQLTLVRHSEGVAPRLVLRDAQGNRVEVDPEVLVGNPLLWHRLESGVRSARERGVLRSGTGAMKALAERIDGDEAQAVFRASGLE